jgi:hypothetical protein
MGAQFSLLHFSVSVSSPASLTKKREERYINDTFTSSCQTDLARLEDFWTQFHQIPLKVKVVIQLFEL